MTADRRWFVRFASQVVRTPKLASVSRLPRSSCSGHHDPDAKVDEGPFGEFTGYSSTHHQQSLPRRDAERRRTRSCRRGRGQLARAPHLIRVPRESNGGEAMRRFAESSRPCAIPTPAALPAYVALRPSRGRSAPGDARASRLDPYVKTVTPVDETSTSRILAGHVGAGHRISSRTATSSSSTVLPATPSIRRIQRRHDPRMASMPARRLRGVRAKVQISMARQKDPQALGIRGQGRN